MRASKWLGIWVVCGLLMVAGGAMARAAASVSDHPSCGGDKGGDDDGDKTDKGDKKG